MSAALRLSSGTTPLPFVLFISFGAALILDLVGLAVTGEFLPAPALLGVNLINGGLVSWLFAIGSLLIIQPISEELVFRGVAFPLLRSRLGAWFGLIAAAALSAMFHLLAYPIDYSWTYGRDMGAANLWYMGLLPFFAAMVFGITRAVTGSTRSAMVAHAAFGLFALLKVFAAG
jgi:membrane protease YdiL (CAAX protease family)